MTVLFFILAVFVTFAAVYASAFFIIGAAVRKRHRKDTDKRIKEAMFKELGFTYRETPSGRSFLVIDSYRGKRAVRI